MDSQILSDKQPEIKDYIEQLHLGVEDVFHDLELFGNKSESWGLLSPLTSMVEQNRLDLNAFSKKLTELKEQHAKEKLPPDLEYKIRHLDGYVLEESKRLFLSPAVLFMPHADIFIQRRVKAGLRLYVFDAFLHAIKHAAVDIFNQYIGHVSEDHLQAFAKFNDLFKSINIDFKEDHLNLTRIALKQDENLEPKVLELLKNAQSFTWTSWVKTVYARAILEGHLVRAHKIIKAECKAYFNQDQQAFDEFWGVEGPFTILADTKYVGSWSDPQFIWNWEPGQDRLDYIRCNAAADREHSTVYTLKAVIDPCMAAAGREQLIQLGLEIPRSSVEGEDGVQLDFHQALEVKEVELATLSGELNSLNKKLSISQTVGVNSFFAKPLPQLEGPVSSENSLGKV